MKPTGVMISRETHSRGTRWSLHGRIWCRRKHRHKCLFGFWWDCESCYTSSLLSHLFVCSLLYFINNSRLKRFKVHSQTNSFASWILSQSFIFCSSPRLLGGFNVLCPRKKILMQEQAGNLGLMYCRLQILRTFFSSCFLSPNYIIFHNMQQHTSLSEMSEHLSSICSYSSYVSLCQQTD